MTFTLLAIIVILAIIAVITVPIILNIIDNLSKGAAVDSAYGYKDAISKYYVSEMIDNQDLKLDGEYSVNNGTLKNDKESHLISTSGTTPSVGWLNIIENEVTEGCLTIDDYKVELKDKIVTAEKGKCKNLSPMACEKNNPNPSPEEWFTFNKKTQTIEGFSDEYNKITTNIPTDIIIPCTIDDVDVVSIGQSAFQNKNLTSVVINDYIEIIGPIAFAANQLTSVKLGSSVLTIGYSAFVSNKLTSIEIPDTVTSLGGNAFAANLIANLKLGSGVSTIQGSTFANNKLTEVVIPDTVTSILGNAFERNQIAELKIPDSVTSIDWSAFQSNQITKLTIGDGIKTITLPSSMSTLCASNKLQSVVLPKELTDIDANAFATCNLTEIIIPEKVENIGNNAFLKLSSANSNPNLSKIINKSKNSFDWGKITGGTYKPETSIVEHTNPNSYITIVNE